jgi:protein-disulfide isomerase
MASRKAQREAARQERMRQEAAEAAVQRRQRMIQLGVGGVLLAAIIVVVLIIVSQSGGGSSGGSATDVSKTAFIQKQLAGIPQHGAVLGDPKAKVTIVEFGDPQCPICKEFSQQFAPSLINGPVRHGEAKYEYRPWLIIGTPPFQQSRVAASAALAAGEQNHFWNYIQLFYENQGEEDSGYVTNDFVTAIAKGAGVPDMNKWNTDRATSKWSSEFSTNNRTAAQLGFTGTPSIYVQGPKGRKIFPNVPTPSQVEAAIKAVG